MMTFDLSRLLPPGWDQEGLKVRLIWGHLLSPVTMLGFLKRYTDARSALYDYQPDATGRYIPVLNPSRTISPFSPLMEGVPYLGMWCFLLVMALQVWRYYGYHTQGAMSVYTMRRLPDRWEFHRRCWAQPILSALAEMLLFAVLTGLCWLIWYFATPTPCRPF